MKNSRKAKQYYTLKDKNLNDVQIDLNNYRVICNKTGARKSFYHKYLHNMIQNKFNGNIDLFREGYVSRQAGPSKKDRQVAQLQAQIERARARLNQLNDRLSLINS